MDFDQWKIGRTYTNSQLTKILRKNSSDYQIYFVYNFRMLSSLGVQEASAEIKLSPLEKSLQDSFTSLEMEFRDRSTSEKQEMVYLWLKFVLKDSRYELNASIKSVRDLNYLREKPQVWGSEPVEIDAVNADSTEEDLAETNPTETDLTETDPMETDSTETDLLE